MAPRTIGIRRGHRRHPRIGTSIRRVSRHLINNAKAYEACAWIMSPDTDGRLRRLRRDWRDQEACAWGSTPRKALGKALCRVGKVLEKRRGKKPRQDVFGGHRR